MSLYDYEKSKKISKDDPPFASLIMSAMRRADTLDTLRLRAIFPKICDELQERGDSPGGLLKEEILKSKKYKE